MVASRGGTVALPDGENHEGPEYPSSVPGVFVDDAVQVGLGPDLRTNISPEVCLKDEQIHHAVAQHNVLQR